KQHESEPYFVELCRINGENLIRRTALGREDVKEIGHVGDRRWRRTLRKTHCPWSVPRTAVVIAHRPTSRSTDRIRRSDRWRSDITDSRKAQTFAADHEIAGEDSSGQSAPEDEARPAQQRAYVVHQNRIIDLSAEQPADDRSEDEVS